MRKEAVNLDGQCGASSGGGMQPRRSVLGNFSWLGLGVTVSRLLQLAVVVYLTRVLGDAAWGRFAFVQAFLWFGVILSDFGLSQIGTREVAKNPRRVGTLASVIMFGRLAVFVAEMVLILLILPVARVESQMFWLFLFSFASLAAYAVNMDWVFRGMERMEYVALWEALPRVVWLVGIVLFVHRPEDLLRVPLLRLAGELVTAGLLVATAWRRYPKSRPSLSLVHPLNVKLIMKEAAPIGLAALLAQVYYNFDVIWLGFVKTDAMVGQYSAAYRIVTLLLTGSFLLAATYQPVLARVWAAEKEGFARHLARLSGTALVFAVTLPAVVAVGAMPVVRVLYGGQYAAAAVPLAILMGAMPFAYMAMAYTTALVATGKQKQMMIATGIGAAVNVIANVLLIPPLGMTGAAIATVISYAAAWGMLWWYVSRLVGWTEPVPLRAAVQTIWEVPRRLLGKRL